jgi:hypothetical protein
MAWLVFKILCAVAGGVFVIGLASIAVVISYALAISALKALGARQ